MFVEGKAMRPEDFIKDYEAALASQTWGAVESLVHDNACVTFSDGSVHRGKHAVRKAFERNFALIRHEEYTVSEVLWVRKSADFAVLLFDFRWQGLVNGKPAGGCGRGTSVLINNEGKWQLLVEHLSKQAS